ncbi:hypothetical protein PsYK624_154060 [Phanerochaete sordida]|uniref:Uncharacterized protein n=1 Tax=Phanerochaete sordida TaxID=48140 RepID=A0A9P3LLX9_9APHY|nr:hypothetical protein PsYK624_154060 [Phanerochaete sordida]
MRGRRTCAWRFAVERFHCVSSLEDVERALTLLTRGEGCSVTFCTPSLVVSVCTKAKSDTPISCDVERRLRTRREMHRRSASSPNFIPVVHPHWRKILSTRRLALARGLRRLTAVQSRGMRRAGGCGCSAPR